MSEASEVCLVRCPKCENLLQEPPESCLYQCGSCGTVLQAKRKESFDNKDLDVSDVENLRGVSDEVDDNAADMVNDFRAEKAMKGIERRELNKNIDEGGTLFSNPSVPENSGGAMATRLEKRKGPRSDKNRRIGLSDDGFKHSSDDIDRNLYTGMRFESELQEFRPKHNVHHRNMDRSRLVSSSSNANSVEGRRGFPNSSYGRYTEQAMYEDEMDTRARVEMLENDRAELLRKLDELSDKLNRSNNVVDEPRETRFYDPRMPPASANSYDRDDTIKQPSSMLYGMSKQPTVADQPVFGHSYMPPNRGYAPNMDGHGSSFLGSYPYGHHIQEYRGFDDVYNPQMLRRPSPQLPNKYPHGSCYEHFPSHSMDLNQDLPNQSACSYMHGFNNNIYVPRKLEPPVLYRQNDRSEYTNHVPYSHANPVVYGPQGYVTEESNLRKLHSQDRHLLTRSSSDLGMETSGFGRRRLKKPVVTQRVRHVFQPIAGGAPFITCCNCSEVLKMPRKFTQMQEKKNKIKCGACSSMLLFEFEKEGLVLSVPAETEQAFVDISASTYESHGQNFRRPYGFPNMGASYTSDEYETLNRDSFSKDVEPNEGLGAQISDKDVGEMGQDPHSFSVASEDESSPDSVSLSMHMFHSSGLISKDEASLDLPDSRDKYLDHLSSDNLMDRRGQGNAIKSSDQEMNFPDKKNSLKDTLVATELDVSYNDDSANAVNQDSSDISRHNDQPTVNKGVESFFFGLIKKSFGSRSSKTTGNGSSRVSVNGHFIPVRIVKKAEKLAGPIQPGDYWYDYYAGFWGVMGHPCLGIILPYIDEFNYPMPRNCAGGNTEILLNGRELHKKDLDLLGARGLPTARRKSYLVEISGRAMDEETGEELDLGKLAPTVEIAKHGFGMKVPKSIPKQ